MWWATDTQHDITSSIFALVAGADKPSVDKVDGVDPFTENKTGQPISRP